MLGKNCRTSKCVFKSGVADALSISFPRGRMKNKQNWILLRRLDAELNARCSPNLFMALSIGNRRDDGNELFAETLPKCTNGICCFLKALE